MGERDRTAGISTRPDRALGALAHPLTLACLAGWLVNDHVLKDQFGNAVTGKLSDVFGLVVFPVLVASVLSLRLTPDRAIRFAIAGTALFFSSINLFAAVDAATEAVLSAVLPDVGLTQDATDLATLPALGGAWLVWARPIHVAPRTRRIVGRTVFAVAVVATMATSADVPRESFSADMISRVEVTDDGFVALHQHLLLEVIPSSGDTEEEAEAIETLPDFETAGLPRGFDYSVYVSSDGRSWERVTANADSIDWSARLSDCLETTCVDIDARGGELERAIRSVDGEVLFEPYEDSPACFDGFELLSTHCDNASSIGPFDLAVDESRDVMVLAMGTEGVAVFEDGDWQQITVDTPRPRGSTIRLWKRTVVLWTVIPVAILALVTFLASRIGDRRRRSY